MERRVDRGFCGRRRRHRRHRGLPLAIAFPHFAAVRVSALVLRSIHELFWALLLIQVFGLGPATGVLAIAIPVCRHLRQGLCRDHRGGGSVGRKGASQRHLGHLCVRLCAAARGRRAVQDLHALSAGMRAALDPGTRLRRPSHGRLSPRGLLQAGQVCRGSGSSRRVLPADRHTSPVGPAGNGASAVDRQPAAATRGDRRRLRTFQPCSLRHARHRAFPLRNGDVGNPRNMECLRCLAAANRLEPDVLPGAWNTIVLAQIALVGMGILALLLFPLVSHQFVGVSASPPAACCSSWSAPRPNTCWPTCCCSC